MVIVIKPFFYWNQDTRVFDNFQGRYGDVEYSNFKGSMVVFDSRTRVFIPKDALKKV